MMASFALLAPRHDVTPQVVSTICNAHSNSEKLVFFASRASIRGVFVGCSCVQSGPSFVVQVVLAFSPGFASVGCALYGAFHPVN